MLSAGFTSPEEELHYLNKQLRPFGGRDVLSPVKMPTFLADLNDPETKALKQKYAAGRKYLIKICKENFLENVLKELTSLYKLEPPPFRPGYPVRP